MRRILLAYGAIHVNVLLVSFFLVGVLNEVVLIALQVAFFALVLWVWKCFKIPKRNLSLKERGLWLLVSLGVMVSTALIMSAIFSGCAVNQETLVTVQDQAPMLPFILFLLNASVVEEVFYREVLWGVLSQPMVQFLLTSFLFTLAHHPSSLITWGLYGSLGLVLGLVRLKADCFTSTLVHLSWNGIVFFLSLL
ncbi:abortive infection protein [Streptococcus pneumoniae]|uniref:CPBP family glutamic-type intramembrane protease n=1 Tax=Streptococcus pneumoniae TaxID=1313 RepID=UPI000598B933|nr:CPBP family glutamic-type intramembrane protease [Streptococcus pneumoniae]CEO70131.1 abortive infection protein [Streptococcus pneumoniae]CEW59101.1 abortive infection protein [Streptococcus pneumoniae]CEX44439.1 abortive infection protein [Streptococcus pneumoniae]CEY74152.1 abortive infection protein [Streptococcus pneumoniae]CGF50748.1 abortive infection protein [Streptococcus pneumoniae]